MSDYHSELKTKIINHLQQIYPEHDLESLSLAIMQQMGLESSIDVIPKQHVNHWDESDVAVITYGDTFFKQDEIPLNSLHTFLNTYLKDGISIVHILPFFPFSSDDGFAVINYSKVNEELGHWEHIENISKDYKLMADLVINHCSGYSRWFEQLMHSESPGKDYFYTCEPDVDLSEVVRPRTSPLLREVPTPDGTKHVWCTFSHDQPDLDFRNTDVLLEFIKIIRLYLEKGVKVFRFDAVAFLWKEPGTSCINLPQTHEIVRLLRTLIEHHTHDAYIITETNIPNRENLSYFGNSNEAHIIYNFCLPPLLVNSLVTGDCKYLKSWLMSMPPAMMGTTYLNFIASHDGIGLRPAEGLLTDDEIHSLVATLQSFGGEVSYRALENNEQKPYEINITLFDALKGTIENGPDEWQQQRFICAHTIMLALEGLPAFYIHSLLATGNDLDKYRQTNNKRAINRHQWDMETLETLLAEDSHHTSILNQLTAIIDIRKKQEAFHPNATQFTLQFGDQILGFWRQSLNRNQSIFCISNITTEEQHITLSDINLIVTDNWLDLLTNEKITENDTDMILKPYQTVWLTNKF